MDLKKLRNLNFKQLIEYDVENPEEYCFEKTIDSEGKTGGDHPKVKSYCTRCEEKLGDAICEEAGFKLCYISHGSTSEDFIASSEETISMTGWHEGAVMFVMENPSKRCYSGFNEVEKKDEEYDIYQECPVTKDGCQYAKWPAAKWYWIHRKQRIGGYPEEFVGGKYGGFVAAVIKEFKLANAYMTNVVKCGLNNPEKDTFRNTGSYNEKCAEICYEHFLKQEIEAVQPKVIFAFGANAYKRLDELGVQKDHQVVSLPHPARRSFSHILFRTVYFCEIAKWLLRAEVIDESFYKDKMVQYALTPEEVK